MAKSKKKHKHVWVPKGSVDKKRVMNQMFGGATVNIEGDSKLWVCHCSATSIGAKAPNVVGVNK